MIITKAEAFHLEELKGNVSQLLRETYDINDEKYETPDGVSWEKFEKIVELVGEVSSCLERFIACEEDFAQMMREEEM